MDPDQRFRQRLPRRAKELIVRVLAEYGSPAEAVRATKEHFGIDITNSGVCHYARSPKWKTEIERHRQALDSQLENIPICSKYWRMRQRQELVEKAIRQTPPDYKSARVLMTDAARELGHLQPFTPDPTGAALSGVSVHVINLVNTLPPDALEHFMKTGEIPPDVLKHLPEITRGRVLPRGSNRVDGRHGG